MSEQRRQDLTLADLRTLPPTLNAAEVAGLLNLGRNQVYELARRGEIPVLKLGRSLRFPTARLLALLGIEADSVEPTEAERRRDDDG